ncbi:ras-related protein Rab-20-like isoform X1 [Tachypleus tridentatus]|uniref:ras-related protein Rab-20-like isoform X1 n=1 Tax=Tachypleus tridentatus TaxID=6853 RepID=UPI003FD4DC19
MRKAYPGLQESTQPHPLIETSIGDLKVVLLGDAHVGKTSLVRRYIDRKFQGSVSTIGASFLLKQWGNYNIAIWDTAGAEKYSGLSSFYCRNAAAAVLTFDLTRYKSIETLRQRYIPLLEVMEQVSVKVVAGTKLDLISNFPRQVAPEEGQQLAAEVNVNQTCRDIIPYFETSSKTGQNVDNVFEFIFEYFFPDRGLRPRCNNKLEDSIVLKKMSKNSYKHKAVCCM